LLSLSPSPAFGPWGILEDPPDAEDDDELAAGAAELDDELAAGAAELDELDEPELPQPATARAMTMNANPP
jgi:hypothetical protein